MRSGEINAWFIARFGWDDVSWLLHGDRGIVGRRGCRWVVAALLALSLMARRSSRSGGGAGAAGVAAAGAAPARARCWRRCGSAC